MPSCWQGSKGKTTVTKGAKSNIYAIDFRGLSPRVKTFSPEEQDKEKPNPRPTVTFQRLSREKLDEQYFKFTTSSQLKIQAASVVSSDLELLWWQA